MHAVMFLIVFFLPPIQGSSKVWTEREDEELAHWQSKVGNRWAEVARRIGTKTGQQCAQRWRHRVNPDIRKEKWTSQEDALLATLVDDIGFHWADISRRIPGRTDQQCMGRWKRHLDPSIRRGEWSPYEDEKLRVLVTKHGLSAWSSISKSMNSRTAQQCRSRWMQLSNQPAEGMSLKQFRKRGGLSNSPSLSEEDAPVQQDGSIELLEDSGSDYEPINKRRGRPRKYSQGTSVKRDRARLSLTMMLEAEQAILQLSTALQSIPPALIIPKGPLSMDDCTGEEYSPELMEHAASGEALALLTSPSRQLHCIVYPEPETSLRKAGNSNRSIGTPAQVVSTPGANIIAPADCNDDDDLLTMLGSPATTRHKAEDHETVPSPQQFRGLVTPDWAKPSQTTLPMTERTTNPRVVRQLIPNEHPFTTANKEITRAALKNELEELITGEQL